jgi:hypothetical protein
MAASPHLQTVPNTPLHDRFTNDEDTIGTRLPSGKCNFRNLNTGGNAVTCGCKRFWDQTVGTLTGFGGARSQSRSGFCMCEHHACYHDDVPETTLRALSNPIRPDAQHRASSVLQRPIHFGQGPVSDGALESGRPPSTVPDTLQFSRYIHTGSSLGLPAIPSQCLLPSDNGSMTSGSQARYTRPFGGLGLGTLSRVPPPGSGDAASLQQSKVPQVKERKLQIYQDANGNDFLQSLTEVATPSVHVSQEPTESEYGKNVSVIQHALGKLVEKRSQDPSTVFRPVSKGSCSTAIKQSASHPGVDLAALPSDSDEDEYLLPRLRTLVNHLKEYPNKVQNHERRLELLENTSFTNPAIDDLQEADDRMETRVSDMEDRIIELEKANAASNDASSVGSKNPTDSSFASRASISSSAMIASALNRVDPSRIESLEAQVAELQAAALPSYARPWEVEVVFLPFGHRLMGIWSSQHTSNQRSRLNSTATNTLTQTQHNTIVAAQNQLIVHDQVSAWERSASDLEQEDTSWLMARACGKGSRIDERLRSRGLVRTIQIMGPDARDVQAAMLTAFADLPALLKEDPYSVRNENAGTIPNQLRGFLGLQSPWIPLRKVHKDSCLRFLNPSEMITQALWTVPFLTSSVAMRQKDIKRLYVTQSDSYIQHLGIETADWTWRKLRQLPRVYSNQQTHNHTPEADAHEPCWNFDDRLDPINESFQSSFASHISSLSIRSPVLGNDNFEPASQSDHFSSAPISPSPSSTPTSVAPTNALESSAIRERHPFRPIHTRTLSMPALVPLNTSQPGKRRITSFEHEANSSPSRAASTSAPHLLPKRRRISRSPSRPRDTPRYSDGPPSPYNCMDEMGSKRDRGMTPFAYATPHSNAPYIDHAHTRSGISIYEDEDEDHPGSPTDDMGAEANALSDSDNSEAKYNVQQRLLEEEWRGVDDEDDCVTGYGSRAGLKAGPEDDEASETSSVPSEYPSTQRPEALFPVSTKTAFRIHVDEEVDEGLA